MSRYRVHPAQALGRVGWSFLIATAALSAVNTAQTASAGATSGTNLIKNGCLDMPSLQAAYTFVGAGSAQIPDWAIGGGGVTAVATSDEQAYRGCSQSIVLSATTSGSVTQTVPTTPGASYALRWEMAGNLCGPALKTMHVFWQHKLVAAPTFNNEGSSTTSMGWVTHEVNVTTSSSTSVVEFADATVGAANCGSNLDAVSLVQLSPPAETVNGFSVTSASDPYSAAVRQMLTKLPAHTAVPSAGAPSCVITAASANEVMDGTGLQLVWTVAPSQRYLKETPAARLASGKNLDAYFTALVKRSKGLYLAALNADRVPLQGKDFADWWAVRIQAVSTSGQLMYFQVASSSGTSTASWGNVYGVSSTSSQVQAPNALASLLYYSKAVATTAA